MSNDRVVAESPAIFDFMYRAVHKTIEKGTWKRNLITGLIIGIALIIGAELFLPESWGWGKAILSIPAIITLWGLMLGLRYFYENKEGKIALKDRLSARKRKRIAMTIGAISLVSTLFIAEYMPYALGGTLLIVIMLLLFDYATMTKDESYLAENNIIDPRDIDQALIEEDDVSEDSVQINEFLWDDDDISDYESIPDDPEDKEEVK